jgi:hypothetical protein
VEILNLGNGSEDSSAQASPKSKKLKVAKAAIGIGTIASFAGLGSTLAANITLNDDQNVEFGQGVAQTAACDADGFTITPISYYDPDSSTFRLDYVEVSGLNLIPEGADAATAAYDASAYDGSYSYSEYADTTAVAAHPGQYYDASALSTIDPDGDFWVNTCDNVVLDFKAYTDDTNYSTNTVDGYAISDESDGLTIPNTISSPLFWSVDANGAGGVTNYDNTAEGYAHTIAFAFDSAYDPANNLSNYGTAGPDLFTMFYQRASNDDIGFGSAGYSANSSFRFFTGGGHYSASIGYSDDDYDMDPIAGAISKITVESLKYFPSDYYVDNDTGPGIRAFP